MRICKILRRGAGVAVERQLRRPINDAAIVVKVEVFIPYRDTCQTDTAAECILADASDTGRDCNTG